jgi:hypothetical protein
MVEDGEEGDGEWGIEVGGCRDGEARSCGVDDVDGGVAAVI